MVLTLPTNVIAGDTGHINAHNTIHLATNGFIFSASAFWIPATSNSDTTAGHLMRASARGAVSGVASLDGNSLVPAAQLPAAAIRNDQANILPPAVGITFTTYHNTFPASVVYLAGSRGTTTVPAAITSGQAFATIVFSGQYDTTVGDYGSSAIIQALATENFAGATGTGTNLGSKLLFKTTTNGVATPAIALIIDQDQSVNAQGALTAAGAVSFATTLAVTGVATFSTISATNTILTDGTVNVAANGIIGIRYIGQILLTMQRDATVATPSGGVIGGLLFSGATDAAHTIANAGEIRCVADALFSAGSSPGRIEFMTTPSASTTPLVRGIFDNAGKVWIGATAATAVASIDQVGAIRAIVATANAGIGYGTGAGAAFTQATSKAQAVGVAQATSVNTQGYSGAITMNGAALASATVVSFTFTNASIAANDCVTVWVASGGTAAAYQIWVAAVSAGSCVIAVRNTTAGSLSEAIVLGFSVVKGAIA